MPGITRRGDPHFIPSIGDFVTPDLLGGAQTTTIAKIVQTLFMSSATGRTGRPSGSC